MINKLLGVVLAVFSLAGCQSLTSMSTIQEAPPFIKVEQLVSKGEAAYRKGNLDVAEGFFLEAIKLDNKDEQSNYRLGNIYFKNGHLKKSASYFSKVVTINPRNAKAHYNLGTIHLMFAENHMKFFTAKAPREFDISRVSKLLGDLDEFSSKNAKSKPKSEPSNKSKLDKLSSLIESP